MMTAADRSAAREVVDEHVRWAEQAATAALVLPDRAEIHHQCRLIGQRNADRPLSVGVFGQFSSGKSTLINALLGAGLLPSSARVTTTVATRLSPAASDSLNVTRREPGQTLRFGTSPFSAWYISVTDSANPAGIRSALRGIMRSQRAAEGLERIDINLKGTVLGSGVLVIDTPGFDAAYPGHHDVAARVASEVDLAIVLIPANDPGGMSLARFMQEVLGDLSDRCVFVFTKFRQVPPEQRDDLHEYLVSWLEQQGFPAAPVIRADATDIAVAAQEDSAGAAALVAETAGEISVEAAIAETRAIARELRALAADRRQMLIETTLEVLLDRLLANVAKAADERRAALERRRAQLVDVPVVELSDLLRQWRNEVIGELARSLRHSLALQVAAAGPDSALERARDRAVEEVGSAQITEIVTELVSETQDILDDWMKRALRQATDASGQDVGEQVELLEQAFTAEYSELAKLYGTDLRPPRWEYQSPAIAEPYIDLSRAAAPFREGSERFQSSASTKSAMAGAIVGSLIFPMAGIAIGSMLGRTRQRERLRIYAEDMHQECIVEAKNAVRAAEPELRIFLENTVDVHIARYLRGVGPILDQLVDSHRTQIARIDADIRVLLAILSEAECRRTTISNG